MVYPVVFGNDSDYTTLGKEMWTLLKGIWAFRIKPDSETEEIICVYDDGRIVQFMQQHPSIPKRVTMKMRSAPEGKDVFRIKVKPDAEGYLIRMSREGPNLVIVNKDKTFVCRPLSDEELPEWYAGVSKVTWE